jgi:hypothetical protein
MEIPISQDIRKFKTKDIGSFSFKEAGFLVLGAGLAFLTYQVFHCAIEVAIIPMGIVLVFGFFKPYGLTFTQFLRTVGKEKLSPTTYIYETDFEYNADEFEELYGDTYDTTIGSEWLIQSNTTVHNKLSKLERPQVFR